MAHKSRKHVRIYPTWWDDRLKVFRLPNKDHLGFDDILVKCECWNGSYIYMWVENGDI